MIFILPLCVRLSTRFLDAPGRTVVKRCPCAPLVTPSEGNRPTEQKFSGQCGLYFCTPVYLLTRHYFDIIF